MEVRDRHRLAHVVVIVANAIEGELDLIASGAHRQVEANVFAHAGEAGGADREGCQQHCGDEGGKTVHDTSPWANSKGKAGPVVRLGADVANDRQWSSARASDQRSNGKPKLAGTPGGRGT